MKNVKGLSTIMAMTGMIFTIMTLGNIAYAYHAGGVAECTGCHSMHNPKGQQNLLLGSDQSSTCLNCHQGSTGPSSYRISTADTAMPAGLPPLQRTPGGDFGWLKKSYTMTIRGTTSTEEGQTHGHNIVASDYSYNADTNNITAPGGSFVSANLGCHSCHDPHGKFRRMADGTIATTGAPIMGSGSYHSSSDPDAEKAVGVYRLLGGKGYQQKSGGIAFTQDPPIVVVNSSYNRSEATTQTRVAYGKGMSDWCAQCHPDMHSNSGKLVHPVGQTLGTIANAYNSYVKSGNITGNQESSYLSLVPYEENNSDYSALKAIASTSGTSPLSGPSSNSMVACISCHRAHASGWPHSLRWNMEGEFIVYDGQWPGLDTTPTVPQFARGRQSAETKAAYYDRPATVFASYQRVLCNKCHAKD